MTNGQLSDLVEAHQGELYRYLRYLGAEATTAEDLVQETFLAAYQNKCVPEENKRGMAAWLRGIGRNQFLMHCRRQRRSRVKVSSVAVAAAEATWSQVFLREGDGFDYVEALRQCLDRLAPKQRQALDLRYAEKQSRSAMAQALSMSEDGVKSLLRRLRKALGNCVEQRLEEDA